jgi:hypothetical protein
MLLLALSGAEAATCPPLPYIFAPNTVIRSAEVNANFALVTGCIAVLYQQRGPVITSTGSANALTVTYPTPPGAYTKGDPFTFIAGYTNTGPATFNVNGLGARPIKLGSSPLAGGEIVADRVVSVFWDGAAFQLLNSANGPHVADDAGLAQIDPLAYPLGISRLDFSAGVGAPALWFTGQTGTCVSHNMNNDGGICRDGPGGNSWVSHPGPEGIDIREFGAVGQADDTPVGQAAINAMGLNSWPAGVAKRLILPEGNIRFKSLTIASPGVKLHGQGEYGSTTINGGQQKAGGSVVVPVAGIGDSASTIDVEADNVEIDGITFACQTYAAYGAFAQPTDCGNQFVRVGTWDASPSPNQFDQFTLKARFVGGVQGVRVYQTRDVDLEYRAELQYSFGGVVSDQRNGYGVSTDTIHVKADCLLAGQYCFSGPAVQAPDIVNLPARNMDIDLRCVGTGFLGDKGCADALTGSAFEAGRVRILSVNDRIAGEDKHIPATTDRMVPQAHRNIDIEVVVHNTLDAPTNIWTVAQGTDSPSATATAPTFYNTHSAVRCFQAPPSARQSGMAVHAGDVYTVNGNTYQVVLDGTTDAAAAPSLGNTPNFGVVDGTALVAYRNPTPDYVSSFPGHACLGVNSLSFASIDLEFHGVGYGFLIQPHGSTDDRISHVTVRAVGDSWLNPIADSYVAQFGGDALIDHLTLLDPVLYSRNNAEPIYIGASSGGHCNNYAFLRILGGTLVGGQFGSFRTQPGCTVQGEIIGTRIVGTAAALNLYGTTDLNIIGGELANTGGTGGTNGIIHGNGTASGLITLDHVGISNTGTADFGTYRDDSGGALKVVGQAINLGYSAAAPADDCSPYLDFKAGDGTDADNTSLWKCIAAPNTWAKAY